MGPEMHSHTSGSSYIYREEALRTTAEGYYTYSPLGEQIQSGRVQRGGDELVRPICFTDPKVLEDVKKQLDAFSEVARLQEYLGGSIADEWGYGGEGNAATD